jgi:hypothetical protein
MAQITLSTAQAQIVVQAHDQIRVCDADGNLLGVLAPVPNDKKKDSSNGHDFTDEEIEAAKRSRDNPGPLRTTKEVLELLRSIRPESE